MSGFAAADHAGERRGCRWRSADDALADLARPRAARRPLLLARESHRPELVGVTPRVGLRVEADLARGEHTLLYGVDLADQLAVGGSVTSRRRSRPFKSVAQRSFASLVRFPPMTCGSRETLPSLWTRPDRPGLREDEVGPLAQLRLGPLLTRGDPLVQLEMAVAE